MEELQEFKLSVNVNQCHLSKLCSIKCASQCCVPHSKKVVGLNWELSSDLSAWDLSGYQTHSL